MKSRLQLVGSFGSKSLSARWV